ncbi:hypothetical protein FH972_022861 [Carpinus fangiana]|uniref:Protein-lysine N-methyltransferase FH972_022861 n=1 Tax=Carpinus fangiana TaxID=176857 RepID=A0A5N6KVP9_9ROSI|nr:hypothetical protein FH972_022861 [Carpinus fangiana]
MKILRLLRRHPAVSSDSIGSSGPSMRVVRHGTDNILGERIAKLTKGGCLALEHLVLLLNDLDELACIDVGIAPVFNVLNQIARKSNIDMRRSSMESREFGVEFASVCDQLLGIMKTTSMAEHGWLHLCIHSPRGLGTRILEALLDELIQSLQQNKDSRSASFMADIGAIVGTVELGCVYHQYQLWKVQSHVQRDHNYHGLTSAAGTPRAKQARHERINNAEDPEDEGTIWFDDSGAEEKMLQFLQDLDPLPPRAGQCESVLDCTNTRVLDLGTGNGHMLFAMQDAGWLSRMVGVDYSAKSVALARQIHRRRREDAQIDDTQIRFAQWDMLKGAPDQSWADSADFDIVLDKGTFDAISLSDEPVDHAGRKGCEVYPERVVDLVCQGGYLLITSCNWTEEELRRWFEGEEFSHHATINYPSFTFGGQKGQTVSSVCFRRKGKGASR